jgi:mannose-6-phosphate isomerase-like protein (cupin superfamily)
MNQNRIDFSSMDWEYPMAGARYKALVHDSQKIRMVEFTSEFKEDEWCEKEHLGFVLEGSMEIDFQGRVEVFQAGDGIFIPLGLKHKASVPSGTVKCFLVEKA